MGWSTQLSLYTFAYLKVEEAQLQGETATGAI